MENADELKAKILELEKKKAELIEKIKVINRRLRYKRYEQKALEPFLEKTKNVDIEPIKRRKRSLEFRIATQAYTPKIEREWIKEVKDIDEKLAEVREIERARKKIRYILADIEKGEKEVKDIEEDLKKIREELRKLYSEMKSVRNAERKAALAKEKEEEELVSLEDLAMIEKE
ncbi:MAG: hypothetical protein QXT05_00115 [Candidatus Bilamarchaeaceae archaeon]